MGFLKFLKREKKESLDELDLPPAPPPLEDFGENMPELPEIPELPDFGEKISAPQGEMPKFEFPEEGKAPELGKENFPDFPSFPEMETEMEEKPSAPTAPIQDIAPIASEAMPATPRQMQIQEPRIQQAVQTAQEQAGFAPPDSYPKIERRLFAREKRILRERPSGKTIYVKVDSFKTALGSINIVRSDLKKTDEALIRLESIKSSKDKSFDRVKMSLDDLQKKLIFVDKILFKGD